MPWPRGLAGRQTGGRHAAGAWYDSPAYQEARQHRRRGAKFRILLVEGSDVTAGSTSADG
ncbi:DUF1330 domain-containing protein [Pseudomonas sp. NFX15]|uniref:DUF1330 domain-containing protein n=1 Tax=Pseudomonas sp. NFX15 TaxID=2816958 RepID=UPI003BA257D8